jgi:hypothetical protein
LRRRRQHERTGQHRNRNEQQFVSEHQAPGDSAGTLRPPRERLVNMGNTAGKGRRDYCPGLHAL